MEHLSKFLLLSCFHLLLASAKLALADSTEHYYYYQPPASSFIRLVGARKGVNATEITDVKSYLHRFGYLDDLKYGTSKAVGNLFDDSLENALLTYQEFFKLNKTGVLDNDTISMMSKPRCGCPDIFKNATPKNDTTNSRFKKYYNFYPNRPRVNTDLLVYEFRTDISSAFKSAIIQAFSDWQPYIPLVFFNTEDPDGIPPDIIVGFYRGDHGDWQSFDGNGNIVAHATPPYEGPKYLHFDADENWQVGSVSDGVDLKTTATHEIGHLLGLAHSNEENAIMYANVKHGEVKKISDDDIAGIRELYS